MIKQNTLRSAIALASLYGFSQAAHTDEASNIQTSDSIIIYGEKQEKNLHELPVSVGVLTEEQLANDTVQNLNDVYSRMANVTGSRGGNEAQFTIRGISVQGLSTDPNSYTAGVYVDDVALDNLSIRYGAMSLWDTEQIEVYRGPQATLRGRNSLIGAVYVKTKDPTYEWGGQAQAMAAENNTYRYSVAGGGGLIEDTLAFRLALDSYESDGFADNITRNEDDYAGFERQNLRAKLLFEPTEDITALLTVSSIKNDVGDNPNVRLDDPFSFEAQSDNDAHHNLDLDTYALDLSWDISDTFTLTSVTTLAKDEFDRLDDYDSTQDAFGFIDQEGDSDSFSKEIRVNFTADNWSGVAGLYYGETDRNALWYLETPYPKSNVEQSAINYMVGAFGLDQATAEGLFSLLPTFIDVSQDYDSNYDVENMAVFGETTWRATDNWAFTLGARYDREDQKRRQETITSVNTVTGNPTLDTLLTGLESLLQTQPENVDTDYDAFLPKGVIQYFWNENINTSFMVQKGYRAGGSSVNLATGTIHDFDPEYTWNYELALRSILMDGDLLLNANMFYTDWKDQQVDVSPSGDSLDKYTGNAGESKLYGFEIETTAFVNDNLEVFANAGYVKTEFKTFTVATGGEIQDYKGNEFQGAPNWTAASGFTYRSDQDIVFGMTANYQGESYLDNANTFKAGSRTVFDARIGYEQPNWSAYLWSKNLFDKEYIVSEYQQQAGIQVQDYATPGDPRMVGATLKASF